MRILFIHNALRSFVRVDRDILATKHDVDELDLSDRSRVIRLPMRLHRADLVYVWFAGLHALPPVIGARLLGKPSVVVVGGYDTAHVPEIGYGSMLHPLESHSVRFICRMATCLLVNSHAAEAEVRANVRVKTPVRVCHHGFKIQSATLATERDSTVLSIGNISRESLARKGHEVFVRAAALLPEARFVLVGQCFDDAGDWLRSIASPNVEIPGFVEQSELDSLCRRASVYVQASAHEGFGCALAEAMLAGCIPVVSRRGALPEVAGDHGVWIDEKDPESVAGGVRTALCAPQSERRAIAARIVDTFSMERRRECLLAIVNNSLQMTP